MKTTLLIISALCLTAFAGSKYKPKDQYYNHGGIHSIIFGDHPNRGVIYGPQFPYGIEVRIPKEESYNLPDNMIELVDALAVFEYGE